MTTGPNHPLRRDTDTSGWVGKARAWWRLNGALVMAPILLAASAALIVIALQVKSLSEQRADDAEAVRGITEQIESAARTSCERARDFAPRVADDYERRQVFPRSVIEQYRRTIPRECP